MSESTDHPAETLRETAPEPKEKPRGRPFVAGFDPRRNLNGRPRDHDALRDLIREIVAQEIPDADGLTYLQAMLLAMVTGRDARDHANILEHAFGKVREEVIHSGADGGPIEHVVVYLPDNGRNSDNRDPSPPAAGSADPIPEQ